MASPGFGSPVFAASGENSQAHGQGLLGRKQAPTPHHTTQKQIKTLSKGNQEWSSTSGTLVLVVALTERSLHMQMCQKPQVQSLQPPAGRCHSNLIEKTREGKHLAKCTQHAGGRAKTTKVWVT